MKILAPTALIAALALSAAGAPGGAGAATVGAQAASLGPCPEPCAVSFPLVFAAAPGEVNRLVVHAGLDDAVAFTDDGAPVTGTGNCEPPGPHSVRCYGNTTSALLGDGDDQARCEAPRCSLSGGDGADTLAGDGELMGGTGADVLEGGAGDGNLVGGPGSDVLHAGPGADRVNGDGTGYATYPPGTPDDAAPDLVDGGPGRDTLMLPAGATAPPEVDLAAGRAGNDTLTSIEDVYGSPGAERLLGDAGPNRLSGNGGADVLDGRAGDDDLDGGDGVDTLSGGPGDDTLHPGREYPDAADRVHCGPGDDLVWPYLRDRIGRDCERVGVEVEQAAIAVSAQPVLRRGRARVVVTCRTRAEDGSLLAGSCTGTIALRDRTTTLASTRLRRFEPGHTITVTLHALGRARLRAGRLTLHYQRGRAQEGIYPGDVPVELRPRTSS
jgi:hypothetical protein